MAERVRRVVSVLISDGGGSPAIHLVAETMGTSVRTLQRRLYGSGITYAAVARQVRCETARRMLLDRQQTIGEIAGTLGYSDPAHFTRAFYRWTGVTPREFRRGQHANRGTQGY
jgi:AraC-like DNA-binding protein